MPKKASRVDAWCGWVVLGRPPGRRPRVHGYSTGVDITFNGFTLRIYTTPVNKAYW